MPGKKVLVGLPWIERIHWQESRVFFDLLRGSFESAPEYDPAKTIDREMEIRLFEHYAARERSVSDSRR